MALHWNWDEKCGEAIFQQYSGTENQHEFVRTLYEGNSELIFLREWEENGNEFYEMYMFFINKEHMEIGLGLKKDHGGNTENIFDTKMAKLVKLRLNKKKCHKLVEIVSVFVKAFDNLEIEIYSED